MIRRDASCIHALHAHAIIRRVFTGVEQSRWSHHDSEFESMPMQDYNHSCFTVIDVPFHQLGDATL